MTDQDDRSPLEEAVSVVAELARVSGAMPPIVHEPLMARIDRDRKRRKRANAIAIAVTVGTAIIMLVVGVAAALNTAPRVSSSGFSWHLEAGWVCLGSMVPLTLVAVLVSVFALSRRPNFQAAAQLLSAHPAGLHEVSNARQALGAMALAAGLPKPPRLYVMDMDSLNAYAVGKSIDACAMGITRAMADALSTDELRAVFAHLLARVVIGNSARRDNDDVLPVQADAEAMYLLRDPRAMLSALERVQGARTSMPMSGSGFVSFYFFAPWMQIPDVLQPLAPLMGDDVGDRIERLRSILGAAGAVS